MAQIRPGNIERNETNWDSTNTAGASSSGFYRPALDWKSRRARAIRAKLRHRALRNRYFRRPLFSDPAWDMLLNLYVAQLEQRRMSISDLTRAASVPGTTSLRWITILESEGLVRRRRDPLHGRRIHIELTPDGAAAISSYFDGVSLD